MLDWDTAAIGRLGALNVLLALAEQHAGITPEEMTRAKGNVAGSQDRCRSSTGSGSTADMDRLQAGTGGRGRPSPALSKV